MNKDTKTKEKPVQAATGDFPGDKPENKALAVQQPVKSNVPAEFEYGDLAGAGFEGTTKDDFAIPMIRVLQALSPQVAGESPLPGAGPGMIFNNVTQELYDGRGAGIIFVPVSRDHNYVRYIPRSSGGGMTGIYLPDDPYVMDAKANKAKATGSMFGKVPCVEEYLTESGQQATRENELVETFYVFGLLCFKLDDAFRTMRAVIPFASTQIKKYKNWMTTADAIMMNVNGITVRPPLFAHRWVLATVPEKNKKGSFFGWRILLDGAGAVEARIPRADPLFQQALEFYELIKSGAAVVAHDGGENDVAEEEVPY